MKRFSREIIQNSDVGKRIIIYNGKVNIRLNITKEMVGRKFGEFILTRKVNNKNRLFLLRIRKKGKSKGKSKSSNSKKKKKKEDMLWGICVK